MLDAAIAAAEIKRLTLHKLRYTFASLLLWRGVSIPKVSYLLGHRDAVITLKVYAHFVEDKKNDVQKLPSSIYHEIYGPVCVVVTAEHSRLESALALQAAFADINVHKSRPVYYYWLN
jgi:hypothetical protein